ncbi:hypothetical protein Pmar_PMAR020105 [Perkinsus marinus ATCC 50983]|uniref:Uncharacterized protein n=1 Tax=Perkinsus marinus (strain ATCC 50983 / TXsc) TaxID=423536 RepID=C5KWQ1_PERM5|nr:hypothetical protein Pmar_PMAR020105 [Perkinsus marinus ATCC 50983]EER11126.1 hypothetical protein Pmar_PMAR020105 [Perkinsus marinus ATCC 50983]|eukprot:XP_002779331.1 hypothetical protein Pmar_PMAR020105 [Perkinsus marinus ATCC 50983]
MAIISVVTGLLATSVLLSAAPSGSYCAAPHTEFGNGSVNLTITSSRTFDIRASYRPRHGPRAWGSKTGVPYEYIPSTGEFKLTDITKLLALASNIAAPFAPPILTNLTFDGAIRVNLSGFDLGIYPLYSCRR